MSIFKINKSIPLSRLLVFMISLSFGIQIIIITYNHWTGFSPVENAVHFAVKVIFGSLLSLIGAIMLTFPDLIVINHLNRFFQWNSKFALRLLFQFLLTIGIACISSALITLLAHQINNYKEGLVHVLIINMLITSVINILLMVLLEGWIFFIENNKSKKKAALLEKELSQIRFEVLKSQINPHFMFNSLNVLSGLIDKDVEKAQRFIDEFSEIYRYVLETIEKQIVTLDEELKFIRSYFYLQQIRYGTALSLHINIESHLLGKLMPPLSLQLVLENAIKHNIVNESKPLKIEIYHENNILIIKNNIQPKISSSRSTGIGQKNLTRRYAMISEQLPLFKIETNNYVVKLPLIES